MEDVATWLNANNLPLLKMLWNNMGVALRVYHSSFVSEEGITKACGCPLLPLKSHIRGPAPASDPGSPNSSYF